MAFGSSAVGRLAARLTVAAQGELRDRVGETLVTAARHIEAGARTNIASMLTVRSRSLLSSTRVDVRPSAGGLELEIAVGGDYRGLRVRYARLQHEGGTVRAKPGKALAIPQAPALTGPGIAKYPEVHRTPWMVMHWAKGASSGVLVHAHTGEVWYRLVRRTVIRAKPFLREAAEPELRVLPAKLAGAAVSAVTVDGGAAWI